MKNTIKFYNLFIPVWMMFLMPPLLIISIVVNLIVDALVVIVVLKINKTELSSHTMYKTILKVFGLGYLADMIGLAILLILYRVFSSVINQFNIWENPISVIVHFVVIGITAIIIFNFNRIVFRKLRIDEEVVFRLAMSMAIITAPWTFLIPSSLFN